MTGFENIRASLAQVAGRLDDAMREGSRIDEVTRDQIRPIIDPVRDVLPSKLLEEWDNNLRNSDAPNIRASVAQARAAVATIQHAGSKETIVAQGGLNAVEGAAHVYHEQLTLESLSLVQASLDAIPERTSLLARLTNGSKSDVIKHLRNIAKAQSEFIDNSRPTSDLRIEANDLVEEVHDLHQEYSDESLARLRTSLETFADNVRTSDSPPASLTNSKLTAEFAVAESTRAVEASIARGPALAAMTTGIDRLKAADTLVAHVDELAAMMQSKADAPWNERQAYWAPIQTAYEELKPQLEALIPTLDAVDQSAGDAVKSIAAQIPIDGGRWNEYNPAIASLRDVVAGVRPRLGEIANSTESFAASEALAVSTTEALASSNRAEVVANLRTILDGTELKRDASRKILEGLLQLPSPDAAAFQRTDAAHVRTVVDEASLLQTTLQHVHDVKQFDSIPEELRPAVDRTIELLDIAGTADLPINESSVAGLRNASLELQRAIPRGAWNAKYALPDALKTANNALSKIDALIQGAATTGLLGASPAERPIAAAGHLANWHTQRLDAMPDPSSLTSIDEKVRLAAARFEIIANLSETADDLIKLGQDASPFQQRVADELRNVGPLWQFPDDTANRIFGARIQARTSLAAGTVAQAGYSAPPLSEQLRDISGEIAAWTFLDGGRLPESDADRVAVASRRIRTLGPIADKLTEAASKSDTKPEDLAAHYRSAYALIESVLDGAHQFLPEGVADRLRSTSATIEHDLDEYAKAASVNAAGTWTPTYSLYTQIRTDAADVDRALSEHLGIATAPRSELSSDAAAALSRASSNDPAPRWQYLKSVMDESDGERDALRKIVAALDAVEKDVPDTLTEIYAGARSDATDSLNRVHRRGGDSAREFDTLYNPATYGRLRAAIDVLAEQEVSGDRASGVLKATIAERGTLEMWNYVTAKANDLRTSFWDGSKVTAAINSIAADVPQSMRPVLDEARATVADVWTRSDTDYSFNPGKYADLMASIGLLRDAALHGKVTDDASLQSAVDTARKNARWEMLHQGIERLNTGDNRDLAEVTQLLTLVERDIDPALRPLYDSTVRIAQQSATPSGYLPRYAPEAFQATFNEDSLVQIRAALRTFAHAIDHPEAARDATAQARYVESARADAGWSALDTATREIAWKADRIAPLLQLLDMVKHDVNPRYAAVHAEAVASAERAWAQVNGIVPEGGVRGYGNHPDYAELGQLRSKISLLLDTGRRSQPQEPVQTGSVTW